MKMQKTLYTVLCAITLAGATVPSFYSMAATDNTIQGTESKSEQTSVIEKKATLRESIDSNEITDEYLTRLSNYVYINAFTKQYQVASAAREALSTEDYELLMGSVLNANAVITEAMLSGKYAVMVQDDVIIIEVPSEHANGVTKVAVHWNYVRVWLSKSTIQKNGVGITIGGVWVPEAVVSKVLASLGALITLVPHGVRFDYNFLVAGLDMASGMTFSAVSNAQWQ